MTDNAIVVIDAEVRLGSLAVRHPTEIIGRASDIATSLAKVVKDRKLSRNISGREYVYVDGWATMGAMIGILPREVSVSEHENGDFEATVELIRVTDGAIVGQGSAIVGYDEGTWKSRPRYAKRSMAITRATGKAYRLGFSWIMSLAGYATTPAEEMDGLDASAETHKQVNPTPPPAPAPKPEAPAAPVDDAALLAAMNEVNSQGELYGSLSTEKLALMSNALRKTLSGSALSADDRAEKERKHAAIKLILDSRQPK